MKSIVIVVFLCLACNVFCQSTDTTYQFVPKYSTILSPEKGERLLKQRARMRHEGIQDFFLLKQEDINHLEKNFQKVLLITPENDYNEDVKISSLEKYGFQYMGVVIEGKKFIYLNAFSASRQEDWDLYDRIKIDWKSVPIVVQGGGNGYWGALFEIESQTFSKLYVNRPR